MAAVPHGKLFRHENGQAVSIPLGFELPGKEVAFRREGPRLIIEPLKTVLSLSPEPKSLKELLATWGPLDEEIGPVEDLPPDPVNL